jgi:hypothetical protein
MARAPPTLPLVLAEASLRRLGTFRLRSLGADPVLVFARTLGMLVEPDASAIVPGGARDVRLVLRAGREVRVTVLDPAGRPLVGALVATGAPGTRTAAGGLRVGARSVPGAPPARTGAPPAVGGMTFTNREGVALLVGLDPSADVTLRVTPGPTRSDLRPIVLPRWRPADSTLRLEPALRLRGRVLLPDGNSAPPALIEQFDGARWVKVGSTRKDGTFELLGMASGPGRSGRAVCLPTRWHGGRRRRREPRGASRSARGGPGPVADRPVGGQDIMRTTSEHPCGASMTATNCHASSPLSFPARRRAGVRQLPRRSSRPPDVPRAETDRFDSGPAPYALSRPHRGWSPGPLPTPLPCACPPSGGPRAPRDPPRLVGAASARDRRHGGVVWANVGGAGREGSRQRRSTQATRASTAPACSRRASARRRAPLRRQKPAPPVRSTPRAPARWWARWWIEGAPSWWMSRAVRAVRRAVHHHDDRRLAIPGQPHKDGAVGTGLSPSPAPGCLHPTPTIGRRSSADRGEARSSAASRTGGRASASPGPPN